ncbi:MAG: transposase [Deltaproteobacteria bacterium]|nr:transposase [Deltaproteobacteria bacterium]
MFPTICQQCAKLQEKKLRGNCRACADLGFDSTILCELNRSVQQGKSEFKCYAFKPKLSLVTTEEQSSPNNIHEQSTSASKSAIVKQMMSDNIKYRKALALQKLDRNPDEEIIELKYHYVWNVMERRPLFADGKESFERVYDTLINTSIPSVLCAALIWLAPDHIHVYYESDGSDSPENVMHTLKRVIEASVKKQPLDVTAELGNHWNLWDEGYFIETIG